MSQAELQRFAAAIGDKPALAERYALAGTSAELAVLMQADGYDVGEEELAAAQQAAQQPGSELTEEQLDRVSGGGIALTVLGLTLAGAGLLALAGAVAGAGAIIRVVKGNGKPDWSEGV